VLTMRAIAQDSAKVPQHRERSHSDGSSLPSPFRFGAQALNAYVAKFGSETFAPARRSGTTSVRRLLSSAQLSARYTVQGAVVRMFSFAPLLTLAIVAVQQKGCERVYRFDAPHGGAAVVIIETGNLSDSEFELMLQGSGTSAIRLAPVRRDCWLAFAHVAWSEQARKVAVYMGDGLCGDTWVAYDRDQRRFLPFSELAEVMRASLRGAYHLSADHLRPFGGDPLLWATASGKRGTGAADPAAEAFRSS
jgi:hypothetical protein